ncbi:MAG: tetratricopeptide repeat protein, partial [Acidobacteriota bacterium]|nr:tetratricopeptide repeat protein [Acidobacteriota bacterium]
ELDSGFADAYRVLGEAELELHDNDAAYRAWTEAQKLSPRDPQTKYYLGRLFYEADFFNEAAAWFREVLALAPKHFPAMTYLGLSAEALGFEETAGQLYRRAIEESKSQKKPYSWAFLGLSKLLRKQGKDQEALKLLEEAEQVCPEAHSLTALGQLLAAEKQNDRAEVVLRRAIQLDPFVSDAHYRLSLLLKAMGQTAEAQVEMETFRRAKDIEQRNGKITAIRK